jgi:hypothetical protein
LKERAGRRRRNSALATTVATTMAKMTGDEAFLAHMTEAAQIDNGQWHIFSSWGLRGCCMAVPKGLEIEMQRGNAGTGIQGCLVPVPYR